MRTRDSRAEKSTERSRSKFIRSRLTNDKFSSLAFEAIGNQALAPEETSPDPDPDPDPDSTEVAVRRKPDPDPDPDDDSTEVAERFGVISAGGVTVCTFSIIEVKRLST
jgi:hypothetical protein